MVPAQDRARHEMEGDERPAEGKEPIALLPWYRDLLQLERLSAERAWRLSEDGREQCRLYLWHLRSFAEPDGLLSPAFESLVWEIFGELVSDKPPRLEEAARTQRVAALIACKNGEATIARTVRSVVDQADVYVVSDGSEDKTVEEALRAGARVLMRSASVGKPDALRAGNLTFLLAKTYDYILILDDDTIVEPGYVDRLVARMDADRGIAAASGRIDSTWEYVHRWNPYVAMRAFMYWSYQTTMKRGQSALRVVNVLCGANSVFRADILEQLIREDAPYAVDDMYWAAEIARRRLGRIEYVPDARSWTIDPHRFRDWYRQTVRWSWGQFQSIRGHRLGVPLRRDRRARLGWKLSWFDTAYALVLVDWIGYALEPLAIVPVAFLLRGWVDPLLFLVFFVAANSAWIALGAIALRNLRLVLLSPVLLLLDLVYRATMLHAAVKTVIKPTVESCRWDSPPRFELQTD